MKKAPIRRWRYAGWAYRRPLGRGILLTGRAKREWNIAKCAYLRDAIAAALSEYTPTRVRITVEVLEEGRPF